jgi:hypothetical protein
MRSGLCPFEVLGDENGEMLMWRSLRIPERVRAFGHTVPTQPQSHRGVFESIIVWECLIQLVHSCCGLPVSASVVTSVP